MKSIARIHGSDETENASLMTIQTLRSPGATEIIVDTVSGVPANFFASMGTPHEFTDPVTGETITIISEATAVDFSGHINSGKLEIDAIAPGYTDTAGSAVGDIVVIRPTTQWADETADILAIAHNDDGTLKSSQGQLFNGKIVPSVTSNNLTVALKTLAGADPSAADPVVIRIGNTVHSIITALSVTLAAGTNWFGKGVAPYVTNPTNFSVYLGFNATDGVVMGISSAADGLKYSDFSTTNTDWTYAKISTTTHAAATDVYENVAYFNAILGASSSYNWSLPANNVSIARSSRSVLGSSCRFFAYRNAGLAQNSNVGIVFDAVRYDHGKNFSTSTGLFTAPVAGTYEFSTLVQFQGGAGYNMGAFLLKNGSADAVLDFVQSTGSIAYGMKGSIEIELNAGDTIGVEFQSTNPGSTTVYAGTAPINTYFRGRLKEPL